MPNIKTEKQNVDKMLAKDMEMVFNEKSPISNITDRSPKGGNFTDRSKKSDNRGGDVTI